MTTLRKFGLDALYFSGANRLLRPLAQGVGAVLMLHRVTPRRPDAFQPNKFLEITPEFLERTIRWLARNAYEFVSLDEARKRFAEQRFDSRFVAFTFDDGFRDNKMWAQPILAKYGVPYTIFVATDFADGAGNLWWLTLEEIVARHDRIEVDGHAFACATTSEKYGAFAALKQLVLSQPTHADERAFIHRLAGHYGYDQAAATRSACMNWDELRELCADPLATIGAHTMSHPILAKMSDADVRAELAGCRAILERILRREIRHLSYPYGAADVVGPREFKIAAEAGYRTAVTTRTGVLTLDDADHLMQLPRITIDGLYQHERYLDVLLSGVAPAAWNALRRTLPPGRPAWA